MDPLSVATVVLAALSSSVIKGLVKDLWEKVILPRLKKPRSRVTITGPSGRKIEVDAQEELTPQRIREIVKLRCPPGPVRLAVRSQIEIRSTMLRVIYLSRRS
jgi:hypothetical protein